MLNGPKWPIILVTRRARDLLDLKRLFVLIRTVNMTYYSRARVVNGQASCIFIIKIKISVHDI